MIARTWRGAVRSEDRAAYVGYLHETGIPGYKQVPGNAGAWILSRDLGNGRTEIVTLSFWESEDAIRGFAGDRIEQAVFYPEDDRYLVERDLTVRHYQLD
jgi:heme-degrading monooxygenase HmoA